MGRSNGRLLDPVKLHKNIQRPGGGPVYTLVKDGVICCQSKLEDCGYTAGMLQELRNTGYELYRDGKALWRPKA